jgi:stage III sporulation protein SpoIIIAA
VLREYARLLSADTRLNVIVVDKTCELAGDSATPHSAIGSARWMPVGKPHMQHDVLREAVENQSPDVIIVDEISTPAEVRLWALLSARVWVEGVRPARQRWEFDSQARRRQCAG